MELSDLWARAPLWWLRAIEDTLAAVKGDKPRNSVSAYGCLKVALVLSARADKDTREAWPAQDRIAEDSGLSLAQVRRGLAILETANIICRRRRQRASAIYTIVFECAQYVESKPEADEGRDVTRDASEQSPESAHSDHSEPAPSNSLGIPDSAYSDQSRSSLIAQNAPLTAQKCGFDYALGERQTERTKQLTLNQKRSVRAVKGKNAVEPSDALVEAMLPHTTDGKLRTAYREAQQALRILGPHADGALIRALQHPRTYAARKPIGFAISAVRDHGGVLDTRGHVRRSFDAEAS